MKFSSLSGGRREGGLALGFSINKTDFPSTRELNPFFFFPDKNCEICKLFTFHGGDKFVISSDICFFQEGAYVS